MFAVGHKQITAENIHVPVTDSWAEGLTIVYCDADASDGRLLDLGWTWLSAEKKSVCKQKSSRDRMRKIKGALNQYATLWKIHFGAVWQ